MMDIMGNILQIPAELENLLKKRKWTTMKIKRINHSNKSHSHMIVLSCHDLSKSADYDIRIQSIKNIIKQGDTGELTPFRKKLAEKLFTWI